MVLFKEIGVMAQSLKECEGNVNLEFDYDLRENTRTLIKENKASQMSYNLINIQFIEPDQTQ